MKVLVIKKGLIQDAMFITADHGHASTDTPSGDDAKTRRSNDDNWTKKGKKIQFCYKLHIKEHSYFNLIQVLTVQPF